MRDSFARQGLVIITGSLALAAFHFAWYSRVVAWRLWELSGGIQREGTLAVMGSSDWAWTIPLHLPAGLLFSVNSGVLALVALLAGSLIAGHMGTRFVVDLWTPERRRLWLSPGRLALFLAGWVWIVVPAKLSWIYQWTVLY